MSKERLEEIKSNAIKEKVHVKTLGTRKSGYWTESYEILKDDWRWLIEQAEQMENLKNAFDDLDSDYIDLVKQNKRYREFIEDMYNHAYGLQLYPHAVDEIKKLLEKTENA